MSEMNKPSESNSQVPANGETLVNGGENKLSLARTLTPSKPNPSDRGTPSPDINVFWVKDQDYPVQNLPEDLTPEPYYQLRARALEDRSHAVTGNCPYDLEILYQFWCHFLLRNFNNSMYSEFKYYANDDAKNRFSFIGLNNLVQYYSKSLSSHHPIRDRVVKDYVELVKSEPAKMEGAAFKTLRSAWRNGALNLKNRKKLADTLDAQVKFDLDRIDI
jgi:la-related protein 1